MKNAIAPLAKRKSQVQNINEVGNVFMTYDYSLFSDLNGNRSINKLHLKRLSASMSEEFLLCPIIVNERYEIIDGQHRFNACQENELPIYFIIAKGYGLNQVHRLNTNLKNWNSVDFAQGYADMGVQEYQEYLRFKKHYGFGHNETVALLIGSDASKTKQMFTEGDLKIPNIELSHKRAKMIYDVAEHYHGYKRRAFVTAMLILFKNKNYDHDQFLQKLNIQQGALVDCTTGAAYIDLIENIYNYKSRKKVSLKY